MLAHLVRGGQDLALRRCSNEGAPRMLHVQWGGGGIPVGGYVGSAHALCKIVASARNSNLGSTGRGKRTYISVREEYQGVVGM